MSTAISSLPPRVTQEGAIRSLRREALAVAQEIDGEYGDGAGTEERRLYDAIGFTPVPPPNTIHCRPGTLDDLRGVLWVASFWREMADYDRLNRLHADLLALDRWIAEDVAGRTA